MPYALRRVTRMVATAAPEVLDVPDDIEDFVLATLPPCECDHGTVVAGEPVEVPCGKPAAWRVTYLCSSCTAPHAILLCEPCRKSWVGGAIPVLSAQRL